MDSKHPSKIDRLPRRRRVSLSPMESHLVATVGEFVGTFLFLFFAYAGNVTAASRAPTLAPDSGTSGLRSDTILFISLAYSLSLLVTVWAFYRISGGLFNPAVTFGLVLSNKLPWIRGVLFIPAQLLASLCAGGLVEAMFPVPIAEANSVLGGGTSVVQGLFMEMLFTALLVFVVLMLAIEKSKDTFLAPVGIGLALFVAMIAGTGYTGGSLNPARSLGCAVAARQFPGYHWIYWLGPFLGSLLATGFYAVVKYFHYEEANPGQDAAHPGEVPRSPV
ncbi:aquaporin-like protein [Immersiella caudata]|uniref:Aquaporin-like protein n=1 Tax=Immersiella caudata TaxID=314043 RepID=A0AA39W4M2_9PEZI|nr:aquaporin-like protein [Immersiella caudata]